MKWDQIENTTPDKIDGLSGTKAELSKASSLKSYLHIKNRIISVDYFD